VCVCPSDGHEAVSSCRQGQHAPRKAASNLGGSAAAGNGQQRLAPELVAALVGAGRFVFDRIRRLKQDMAAARLEMLRGRFGSLGFRVWAARLCPVVADGCTAADAHARA
jgi:hypothetical protein